MSPVEITTKTNSITGKILIELKSTMERCILFAHMEGGIKRMYSAHDFYSCFGLLRADFSEMNFLCKGSKINVHTSRISSQMSRGLLAYEHELGRPCENDDLVRIFDYDDENITNDIQLQKEHYRNWLESLRNNPNLQ